MRRRHPLLKKTMQRKENELSNFIEVLYYGWEHLTPKRWCLYRTTDIFHCVSYQSLSTYVEVIKCANTISKFDVSKLFYIYQLCM